MAPSIHPLRFFRIMTTQPSLIVWTFVVLVLIGVVAVVRDPSRSVGAMAPMLLLQLFAASSGFEMPARRGHYDLLLTSGHRRVWMALVHWGTSVAPGVVAWLVLAAVERIASNGSETGLLASGTVAAIGLVSTLPWAITVRLPRYSGGIGWLLVLAISTSVWPSTQLWAAWRFLVYPVGVVGHELSIQEAAAAAPALVLALGSMAVACRWVSRASVPLEAAQ
jgi:hypothetical protein